MIVVTGGAGFIGSNLVRSLVADAIEVAVVDDAALGTNLGGVRVADHLRQDEFLRRVRSGPAALAGIDAVLHQGACSDTTEADEDFLRRNNLEYSVAVLDACQAAGVPLLYASSASVYGSGPSNGGAAVDSDRALNGYARSKARFDAHVAARAAVRRSQVVGLRYFNVYGPGERHKGSMASVALQLHNQLARTGTAEVFGAGGGAAAGQHRRDFVHVDDVVAVVRWFLDHPDRSGTFDCGTGTGRTFLELAQIVVQSVGGGEIRFAPFPASMEGRYQADTRADLERLRGAGCEVVFTSLEVGVGRYVAHLDAGP